MFICLYALYFILILIFMQINQTEPSIDFMTGKKLFKETKASQVAAGDGDGDGDGDDDDDGDGDDDDDD